MLIYVCTDIEWRVRTRCLQGTCCIFVIVFLHVRRAQWRADATPAGVRPRAAFSRTSFALVDLLFVLLSAGALLLHHHLLRAPLLRARLLSSTPSTVSSEPASSEPSEPASPEPTSTTTSTSREPASEDFRASLRRRHRRRQRRRRRRGGRRPLPAAAQQEAGEERAHQRDDSLYSRPARVTATSTTNECILPKRAQSIR